ncbi:PQQ-dependent sugar dehydrogenase [Uruburuella testudinis]|uniref:PQQ-dependent sugar dehydrogenase n=1 Tax=Uruburuella testudinis TaxID=1282863 RepID=A0ABY4DQY1_9NEIS|nr:PQQ-dependent sugar dehydrogenase [Uruburuella testudinis]UOO81445.1 PQQ-dependent sugar dehydrogenase [Uruburuella testudinis]
MSQMSISSRFVLPALLALSAAACAENSADTNKTASAVTASAAVETAAAIQAHPVDAAEKWQWQTMAQGLNHPWGLAFLPDGSFLITERSGTLRVADAGGQLSEPLGGLPEIDVGGQGGLLDVVPDTDFARSRRVYFCFSEPGRGGNSTALAEGVLAADKRSLTEVKTLFSQQPKVSSRNHFGCRIALTSEHIFMSMGDRYSRREDAQNLNNHIGKIVCLNRDGSIPADNPFVNQSDARGEIWSYGHRNVQGLTLDSRGRLWANEHGAQGGDEINRIEAGKNYGWPVISYGKDYGGGKIGEGSAKAGMQQPLYYWDPSIAPSGMAFVGKNPYGSDWNGNLLIGALKFGYLARLMLEDGKVVREEKIEVGERVRDVRQASDGTIYILTDSSNGKLMKLLPR